MREVVLCRDEAMSCMREREAWMAVLGRLAAFLGAASQNVDLDTRE